MKKKRSTDNQTKHQTSTGTRRNTKHTPSHNHVWHWAGVAFLYKKRDKERGTVHGFTCSDGNERADGCSAISARASEILSMPAQVLKSTIYLHPNKRLDFKARPAFSRSSCSDSSGTMRFGAFFFYSRVPNGAVRCGLLIFWNPTMRFGVVL